MNISKVVDIIKNKGYEAELREITKGSVKKVGITIGEGTVKPTIFPDSIAVKHDATDEEIADKVIELYGANKVPTFDTEQLTDPEYIKKNMFVSVRRPIEDDAFAKSFLDIQLALRAKVQVPNGQFASYIVKKVLAEKCGFDESIFDEAIKNMEFEFKPLGSVIGQMLDTNDVPECGMYVVSTIDNCFGGSAIYDKVFLKSIADLLDSDLVIIPSSVDELIVLKYDEDTLSINEMDEMVLEINKCKVEPDKQLSDHIYIFLRGSSTISF